MGFTDLLSSSRGPGVIGTLLALLVLVGFGTLYLFVFDEGLQGGKMSIEAVIRHQGHEIDNLKIAIENGKTRLEDAREAKEIGKKADELEVRAGIDQARIAELTAAKADAEAAVAAAEEAWEKYKDQYRASEWAKAEGEKLGEVRTLKGDVLTKVVITGVDHTGVKISYSGGLKTIPPEDLPVDLHDRFQFSEEKTKVVKKKMSEDFGDLSNNVEIAKLAKNAQGKLATVEDLKQENSKLAARVQQAKINLPRQQVAVDRQRLAISKEKSKRGGISRAPEMQVQLRVMERALRETQSSIPDSERKMGDNKRRIDFLGREVDQIKDEIARIKKELASKNQDASKP